MNMIAPKGTKDIMPDQVYRWHYVENKFKLVAEKYGYSEIRTPLFESTELFERGVGDTTDIVQKEMYTFMDYGDRRITLKPEGTASCVRAFLEHKIYAEPQPTKIYYETPCYRYEKPQADRLREFHQFGVEVFGSESMLADAEIISLANDFLKDCGITDLKLRINSIGCPSCREDYKTALRDYYRPHFDELCDTCKTRFERNPMRIIDCKSSEDKKLSVGAPNILDYLCTDCKASFEELKENLDALGIDYTVDPTIVRGLDYYTKTAFEFTSERLGAQGTVCGGGRYDNLIYEIGQQDVPGVGFGLGIERLLSLMEKEGVEIPKEEPMDALIVVLGEEARKAGVRITKELRDQGLKVEMDIMERNIKGQLKYADRRGVRYAVVIGDEEILNGEAQVRDMRISEQRSVPFSKLNEVLSK